MNHGKYTLKILSHCNYLYVKSLILGLWSHVSAFIYTMETKIVLRGKRMFLSLGAHCTGWRMVGSRLTSAFFSDLGAGQGRRRTTVTPPSGHWPLTFGGKANLDSAQVKTGSGDALPSAQRCAGEEQEGGHNPPSCMKREDELEDRLQNFQTVQKLHHKHLFRSAVLTVWSGAGGPMNSPEILSEDQQG